MGGGCFGMKQEIAEKSTICDVLDFYADKNQDEIVAYSLDNNGVIQGSLSYQELQNCGRTVAFRLRRKLKKQSTVIVMLPTSLEYEAAILGCFYGGIIAVPVCPPANQIQAERLLGVMVNSMSEVIITSEYIYSEICKNKELIKCFAGKTWVFINNVNDFIFCQTEQVYEVNATDIAFLQYTSGSTGEPKGVAVSHKSLMHNLKLLKANMDVREKTLMMSWLPLFFDMGLIGSMFVPIYSGASVILMDTRDFLMNPFLWIKAMSDYKVEVTVAPNFAYQLCSDKISEQQLELIDLSSLRTVYNGAELVRKSTLDSFCKKYQPCGFKKTAFLPTYGMAEHTLFITGVQNNETYSSIAVDMDKLKENTVEILDAGAERAIEYVSCGEPPEDVMVKIIDLNSLTECDELTVGEIWVKSDSMAGGYWNNTEASKEVFDGRIADSSEHGFLRTGDLGFLYKKALYITGRYKDLVIINGKNYYCKDIEYVCENSNKEIGNSASALFAIEEDENEKIVYVAELICSDSDFTSEEKNKKIESLTQKVKHDIYSSFGIIPYDIVFLKQNTILKTVSGKVQRSACRLAYLDNRLEKWGA